MVKLVFGGFESLPTRRWSMAAIICSTLVNLATISAAILSGNDVVFKLDV